ncbi:MAG: tetratricopeptide repeat protein [bacterium]|nr:tetratricopeptide repeat protein [bacterium]
MNQKTCAGCGNSIEASVKFCSECGASAVVKPAASPKTSPGGAKKTAARDSVIVVGVLLIVTAGFFVLKGQAERPVDPSTEVATDGPHAGQMSMDMLEGLPADYRGLVEAGNKFYDESSFAVAAEVYSRALAIDGRSPDVRTDYGACLYAMGIPERAADEFRTVIRTSPEHAIANFNLGIVYHSMQQEDSARVYWERYLELDPDGPPAATARELLKELDS